MSGKTSGFDHKVRVRVCGLLVEKGKILLAQIHSPVSKSLVWTPPGGGLRYGETMKACLQREFVEETNLQVRVGDIVHINELISLPYHALEYYYEVERMGGKPRLGHDPELAHDQQLLRDLQWIPFKRLLDIVFAPPGLLKKLQDWENRFSYPIIDNLDG
ncbi:MAG: NUDIX domain-containing protein [Balneolaceae bacterium]|jgi:8-oxo-dGTP diphosphatase